MSERPNWIDYFLGIAFVASLRSLDGQTKHGAVITDHNNHILGTGYNSFPRKMTDESLPKLRPEKYEWMIHAEVNAVSNCAVNLWNLPYGAVAYITGQPCNGCAKHLWQNNVTTWYIAKRKGSQLESPKTEADFKRLKDETGVNINYVDINIDWIKQIWTNL